MKIKKHIFGGVDLMGEVNTYIFYTYEDSKTGNRIDHGLFNYFFVKSYKYHGEKKGFSLI